jgi:hypothetical protein
MLKLVKIQKNTIVYVQLPLYLHILKWIDTKFLQLILLLNKALEVLTTSYVSKISSKIDAQYKLKKITKITAKYPKIKKGKQ